MDSLESAVGVWFCLLCSPGNSDTRSGESASVLAHLLKSGFFFLRGVSASGPGSVGVGNARLTVTLSSRQSICELLP